MSNNKPFGKYRIDDDAIGGEDLKNFYVPVASSAELASITAQDGVIVTDTFRVDDVTYYAGDVLIKNGEEWVKLDDAVYGLSPNQLGGASNLRGYRLGEKVYIKWKDPVDQKDANRHVTNTFKRSILVRKYGGTPTSIFDGTQVCIEDTKNSFNSKFFVDTAPALTVGGQTFEPHYRVFTIARNGYISASVKRENDQLVPYDLVPEEFSWSVVQSAIQNGEAYKFFAVGDVVTVNGGGVEFNFLVVGMDDDQAEDQTNHPHTLQLLFDSWTYKNGWFDNTLALRGRFDTRSTVTVNGSTYIPTADTSASQSKIADRSYYTPQYETVDDVQQIVGMNNESQPSAGDSTSGLYEVFTGYSWADSDLRREVNAEDGTVLSVIGTASEELRACIVNTVTKSATKNGVVTTIDKFKIPSVSEIFGVANFKTPDGWTHDGVMEATSQYKLFRDVSKFRKILIGEDEYLNNEITDIEDLLYYLYYGPIHHYPPRDSNHLLRSMDLGTDPANAVYQLRLPGDAVGTMTGANYPVSMDVPYFLVFSIG